MIQVVEKWLDLLPMQWLVVMDIAFLFMTGASTVWWGLNWVSLLNAFLAGTFVSATAYTVLIIRVIESNKKLMKYNEILRRRGV